MTKNAKMSGSEIYSLWKLNHSLILLKKSIFRLKYEKSELKYVNEKGSNNVLLRKKALFDQFGENDVFEKSL